MAIVTGDLYKGFTFGDISSKAYGVYITQEAAYNAPERDVSVYEIAGRNGAYILDNGRFRNITVTYRCGIALDSETDFEAAVRSFRNALASQAGKYVRLTDEYNPDEFRQAAFFGGIEVEMADRRAGEFTVSFDCKPQRFLASGEDAVAIASSGDTITNPTLFEAKPILRVWGYGDIGINGESITIDDGTIGDFLVQSATPSRLTARVQINLPADKLAQLNAGDAITTTIMIEATQTVRYRDQSSSLINSAVPTVSSGTASAVSQIVSSGKECKTTINIPAAFSYGTSASFEARTDISLGGFVWGTGSFSDAWFELTTVAYDGNNTITITTGVGASGTITGTADAGAEIGADEVHGNSTKSVLGEPLYFDMDIGEAYKEEDGEIVSVNNAVSFPAELPVLISGANAITFDNTVTKLEVVPRWWEV